MTQIRSKTIILPMNDSTSRLTIVVRSIGADDVHELGEPAAVIELGRAEHLGRQRMERGQEDDHVEAEPFPLVGHEH
jgi:hypothetical protein